MVVHADELQFYVWSFLKEPNFLLSVLSKVQPDQLDLLKMRWMWSEMGSMLKVKVDFRLFLTDVWSEKKMKWNEWNLATLQKIFIETSVQLNLLDQTVAFISGTHVQKQKTNCLYIIGAQIKLIENVFQMLKMQTILSITFLLIFTFPWHEFKKE